jgi:hypothetical protein
MPSTRAFTTIRQVLELDGATTALHSVAGGAVRGEVVRTPSDGGRAGKRIGAVRYEPFTIGVALPLVTGLGDWVASFFVGGAVAKSGSVSSIDGQGATVFARRFTGALITEITIPALDGASKDSARLAVTIAPGHLENRSGDAAKLPAAPSPQKTWLASNFRLELKGVPTKRVDRIEPLSVRTTEAAGTDVGDLRVRFAAVDVAPWLDWFHEFVVGGDNGPDRERSGTLELLSSTGAVLATIDLEGVGIFSLTPAEQDPGTDAPARWRAEMYVQRARYRQS